MKNNTVVTASDMNYLWGVFLLIASMRKNHMDEPVIVLGRNYTPEAKRILAQFGDVTVHNVVDFSQSMTCAKADAMLLAETDYITWADCDGFFSGNCSEAMSNFPPDRIHIRLRTPEENRRTYARFYRSDTEAAKGKLPEQLLECWQRDVGSLTESRLSSGASACFLGVNAAQRPFLAKWRDQMLAVLPKNDIGVVNTHSMAYFQTDESVLNSLLCFLSDAPLPTDSYGMNQNPEALFIHFVSHPKPWAGWTNYAWRHYKTYLAVVEYVLAERLDLPGKLPFPLRPGNEQLCKLLRKPIQWQDKFRRVRRKLRLK